MESPAKKSIETPITEDFWEGVKREKEFQLSTWSDSDARKTHAEWYWLVGFLAGKALTAAIVGDRTKALHHTISAATALSLWHDTIR